MDLLNIKNYIKTKQYGINLFDDYIYINKYKNLKHISEQKLIIDFANFAINIEGNSFRVLKMFDDELLIKGKIESMNFSYE